MKNIATWIEKNCGGHFDELFDASTFRLWNARTDGIVWDKMDGLLLTGGSDISAEFLRQDIPDAALILHPDPPRDRWEFSVLQQALDRGLPTLAICRGQQVLNVAFGGTLHLDVSGHNLPEQKYRNIQELRHAATSRIRFPRVNSSHHQAIANPGEGLEVEAWHPGDEIIEQVRLRDYPFCLGVQYHPERDTMYRPLFDAFLAHLT